MLSASLGYWRGSSADMGLVHFSRTAAANETADPNTYVAEGQGANTINNAIRGLMSSLAQWRDDNSGVIGAIHAGGNTYDIATYQQIPSLSDVFTLSFWVDANNTGPVKLRVDGLAAKDLRRPPYYYPMAPGDLNTGTFYTVTWS